MQRARGTRWEILVVQRAQVPHAPMQSGPRTQCDPAPQSARRGASRRQPEARSVQDSHRLRSGGNSAKGE